MAEPCSPTNATGRARVFEWHQITIEAWLGGVPISDRDVARLPVPSIVRRAKIAVIDADDAANSDIARIRLPGSPDYQKERLSGLASALAITPAILPCAVPRPCWRGSPDRARGTRAVIDAIGAAWPSPSPAPFRAGTSGAASCCTVMPGSWATDPAPQLFPASTGRISSRRLCRLLVRRTVSTETLPG